MAYIINSLDILVIDLDGTLLDTNYTNLIPYKDVLSNKFGMSYLISCYKNFKQLFRKFIICSRIT